MAMSKDRVRFILGPCLSIQYVQLVKDTLGATLPTGYSKPLTIICRPSQFARFLIERNNRGICNEFKALRPELFTPNDPLDFVDCSENFW